MQHRPMMSGIVSSWVVAYLGLFATVTYAQDIPPQPEVSTNSVTSTDQTGAGVDHVIINRSTGVQFIQSTQEYAKPRTLGDTLGTVDWDPAVHGPLLAIAPERIIPDWVWRLHRERSLLGAANRPAASAPTVEPPSPPIPDSQGRYAMTDLTSYFNRRLRRVDGFTVIAPVTTLDLHVPDGNPPPYPGTLTDLKRLEVTLTDAQWQQAAAPAGLGVQDLTGAQQTLFLAALPHPFVIIETTAPAPGTPAVKAESPVRVLTAEEAAGVRLHLELRASYWADVPAFGPGTPNAHQPLEPNVAPAPGSVVREVESTSSVSPILGSGTWISPDRFLSEKSYRELPQQIDFSAANLAAPVDLSGAATVGQVVDRIRNATGVEIRVDRRLADRAVWLRVSPGASAFPAGRVLHALCVAAAFSVRSLGDGVYDVTTGFEGYGATAARVARWAEPPYDATNDAAAAAAAAAHAHNPLQYLSFDADDPVRPSDALLSAANWPGNPRATVALSQTPESVRRAYAERTQGSGPADVPVDLNPTIALTWLVPGVGPVNQIGNSASSGFQPSELAGQDGSSIVALSLPPDKTGVVGVCLAATTSEEAAADVRAVLERGLHKVWIRLPEPDGPAVNADEGRRPDPDAALLDAARGAATSASADVTAAIPVLSFVANASDAPPKSGVDFNILGELAPPEQYAAGGGKAVGWLTPDTSTDAALERMHRLVQAGAAVALVDTAPPGYGNDSPPLATRDGTTQLGYTNARRVDCLRSAGIDPVDILTVGNTLFAQIGIPQYDRIETDVEPGPTFIPDLGNSQKWSARRRAAHVAFLQSLRSALAQTQDDCLVESRAVSANGLIGVAMARAGAAAGAPPAVVRIVYPGAVNDRATALFATSATRALHDIQTSQTLILDVSRLSISEAKRVLDQALQVAR